MYPEEIIIELFLYLQFMDPSTFCPPVPSNPIESKCNSLYYYDLFLKNVLSPVPLCLLFFWPNSCSWWTHFFCPVHLHLYGWTLLGKVLDKLMTPEWKLWNSWIFTHSAWAWEHLDLLFLRWAFFLCQWQIPRLYISSLHLFLTFSWWLCKASQFCI